MGGVVLCCDSHFVNNFGYVLGCSCLGIPLACCQVYLPCVPDKEQAASQQLASTSFLITFHMILRMLCRYDASDVYGTRLHLLLESMEQADGALDKALGCGKDSLSDGSAALAVRTLQRQPTSGFSGGRSVRSFTAGSKGLGSVLGGAGVSSEGMITK